MHTLRRGYNIGQRLIDEYLAKSKTTRCSDFRETAERIAKASTTHRKVMPCLPVHTRCRGSYMSLLEATRCATGGGGYFHPPKWWVINTGPVLVQDVL